ncbi:MAG: FMN-binding protein [Oscillibacter sp.]|nr:FMN-binding protein [Oscillibacter sp.]
MLISLILAWLAVLCAVFAVLKFFARISKNRKLNRFFSKIHISFGVLLLAFGLLHSIFAGNMPSATLADFTPAAVLFTWNWGTACLVLALLLALTYVFRKQLKKHWMPAHRVLTVLLVITLGLHLLNVGIQLFDRLGAGETTAITTTKSSSGSASSPGTTSSSGSTSSSVSSSSSGKTSGTISSDTAASSDTTPSDTSSSSGSGSAVAFSGAQLKDGTYQGSASGYNGNITVSVTVSGGEVTDIAVVSESDTASFFSKAKSVLASIISGQTLEVDTVSGATYSSAGLINATYNALQSAVTSGTLNVTSIDLFSVRRK